MMILSALLVVVGFFGVKFGGPVWVAAAACGVPLVLYLLHDMGVIAWRDDFQREVAMRSGMHALVAVGLVCAMVLVTDNAGAVAVRSGDARHDMVAMAGMTLQIAAIIWGMSWLVQYWGGHVGAIRILWVLLGINIIDTAGTLLYVHWTPANGWIGYFAKFSFYPIAALVIIGCRRWHRVGGAVLCVYLIARTWIVTRGMVEIGLMEDPLVRTNMIVMMLPLIVPALTLLSARHAREA